MSSEPLNKTFHSSINTNYSLKKKKRHFVIHISEELHTFEGHELTHSLPRHAMRFSAMAKSSHSSHLHEPQGTTGENRGNAKDWRIQDRSKTRKISWQEKCQLTKNQTLERGRAKFQFHWAGINIPGRDRMCRRRYPVPGWTHKGLDVM